MFDFEGEFKGRTPGTQGGFQAAGTCVSIAFGVVGGAAVGGFPVVYLFKAQVDRLKDYCQGI